jgi:hypothetical protein
VQLDHTRRGTATAGAPNVGRTDGVRRGDGDDGAARAVHTLVVPPATEPTPLTRGHDDPHQSTTYVLIAGPKPSFGRIQPSARSAVRVRPVPKPGA